jgi:hypothetical protein
MVPAIEELSIKKGILRATTTAGCTFYLNLNRSRRGIAYSSLQPSDQNNHVAAVHALVQDGFLRVVGFRNSSPVVEQVKP